MQAVLVRSPGGIDQLELGNARDPGVSGHDVLIEVHAAGLNRADLLQRRGLYPPPPGESELLGLECAGVVRSVGREVTRFAPGDRVMALVGGGAYAELVSVHEQLVMRIPGALSFVEAAAIPEAFLTAYEALLRTAALSPGERALIHAGASGVGSAAIQLAGEIGAFVFATARGEKKRDKIAELGAERPIDASAEDFEAVIARESGGHGVDVIVDLVGASYAEKNHSALAIGGRWVVVGLVGGSKATIDFGRLLMRRQTVCGIVMRARPLPEKSAIVRGFATDLLPWFETGRLRPVIDSVFPWSDVQSAHARMEQNANLGKIVLTVR